MGRVFKETMMTPTDKDKLRKKKASAAAEKYRNLEKVTPPNPGWFKAMIKAMPGCLWKSKKTLKAEAEAEKAKIQAV